MLQNIFFIPTFVQKCDYEDYEVFYFDKREKDTRYIIFHNDALLYFYILFLLKFLKKM